jgi:hypothetical protein
MPLRLRTWITLPNHVMRINSTENMAQRELADGPKSLRMDSLNLLVRIQGFWIS